MRHLVLLLACAGGAFALPSKEAHVVAPEEKHAANPARRPVAAYTRTVTAAIVRTEVRADDAPAQTHETAARVSLTIAGGEDCASSIVYNAIINSASGLLTTAKEYEPGSGSKAVSTIILIVMLVIGLFLVFAGEAFVMVSLMLIAVAVSFTALLYLFDFALRHNDSSFVACILPLILAGVSAVVIGIIISCLRKTIYTLSFFVFGAAAGVVGMLMLRQVIVSSNPSIGINPYFDWYWAGVAVVGIITGIIGTYLKEAIVWIVCIGVGSFLVTIATIGMFNLYDVKTPAYAFWILLGGVAAIGVVVHCMYWAKKSAAAKEAEGKGESLLAK